MSAFKTTGNLFADYLLYDNGRKVFSLQEKKNVDSFVSFFMNPCLFCDELDQSQISEIRAPLFTFDNGILIEASKLAPIERADGKYVFHPGHILKRDRYIDGEYDFEYCFDYGWASGVVMKLLQNFTIKILTKDMKYSCFVKAFMQGLWKYSFQWERSIEILKDQN